MACRFGRPMHTPVGLATALDGAPPAGRPSTNEIETPFPTTEMTCCGSQIPGFVLDQSRPHHHAFFPYGSRIFPPGLSRWSEAKTCGDLYTGITVKDEGPTNPV